jgi:hypothetical protein
MTLTASHIYVQPILTSTSFTSLPPVSPGFPLSLLPYGTAATYLATYTGPHASLAEEFDATLSGLGAGPWSRTAFHVVWIPVAGEDDEPRGVEAAGICGAEV